MPETSMKPLFQIGQQIRILGVGGRLVNLGKIVEATRKDWIVLPDGCTRVRFARKTLMLQPNPNRQKWPRIAP